MNRSSSRINKKKAIPLYFQKSHSNSQFLATANYKHQIKTLKKTNKELACSLQDAKIRVADHEKALAECSRENTQTRQDGAPPHWSMEVRTFLNHLPKHWIG
ncbi:unnamed protein product [Larinioides sclopetarius]|uniref:Uncharacterized protein n=1 Tax=Larinioides sclopetarius TaxID=280406 RepID=A0AAV2BFA5_9ARAC